MKVNFISRAQIQRIKLTELKIREDEEGQKARCYQTSYADR